jgi:transcription antitermination factor NusA-like protein
LAARLTGWKIDIKSESRFREMLEQEILARFTAATESAVNESEAQADAVNGSESQPDAAVEPVSEPAPASAGDASAEQTD